VWTPKRRKPVLTGDVAQDCKALIEAKCQEYGWRVIELAIQPDHVHLFVETFPTTAASEVVKQCKGVTSHELREKYLDSTSPNQSKKSIFVKAPLSVYKWAI
jgi:putative transposase